MKYAIVTTFSFKGYHEYGKRMLSTFDKYWPNDVDIHAFYEGQKPTDIISNRIFFHDLSACCPDLVKFKEKYKNDPVANGQATTIPNGVRRPEGIKEKWINQPSFLWDAVRFSHKTFCQAYATTHEDVHNGADVMFWLDADTITFRNITEDIYSLWLPENCYVSYLGRPSYSECGFLAYNLKHLYHQEFMNRWVDLYNTDKLFDLWEWHDCLAFDTIRREMEEEGKIINHNLNGVINDKSHPFINSVLGQYIDHLKGKRKNNGRSFRTDIRQNTDIDYWNGRI